MLAFEHRYYRHLGSKEQAVTDLFGISAVRYQQALNVVIDHPDAYVLDPSTVKRLRRLREDRRAQRRAG